MKINFTNQEQTIINILLQVIKNKSPNTTLRLCGGIVRDKLLSIESNDLDIAVDNMSGVSFGNLILEWIKENNINNTTLSVIKSNPNQSKHLETAIINICGKSIDIVNLRKETYSDTRIPQIEIGTPEEDAFRRDFTINSLFYNINTNQLEDFTNMGLNDISNKIIRTPIDPTQTFLDDGLRILRGIKFSARYDFELTSDLINAAKNKNIQEAFRTKISPERIWKELAEFLTGPNPTKAARLLGQLGLRDILFKPTTEEAKTLNVEFEEWDADQNSKHHDLSIWEHSLMALEYLVKYTQETNIEELLVRNITILLHDFGKCCNNAKQIKEDGTFSYLKHECYSAILAEWALLKLKAPTNIIQRVKLLCAEHMRLHVMDDNPTDKALRKFIKELGSDYKNSCNIAKADAAGKLDQNKIKNLDRYDNFKTHMELLEKEIQNGGGNMSPKRPISGNDLIQIGWLPGPKMGVAFKALDEQLLETPNMDKDEAILFIISLNLK